MPASLFWATYEQQGNTIALWAEDFTVRSFDLGIWHGEVPAELFQSINPFLIFAFTPFIVVLWSRQAQRGSEPSTVSKMALSAARGMYPAQGAARKIAIKSTSA